jgi:CBS domain containing-hemolysin-like protein
MEDVIETLLGVEIVDEADQDAIEEGAAHEDLRELAMRRNNDSEE